MLRPSAICGFALVTLLSAASAGCFASTGSSREVTSPEDVARGASFLVGPATVDAQNVYLPAVLVLTTTFDLTGDVRTMKCSGVLIHPRVVVTAGHCVCLYREPTSADNLPTDRSPEADAGAVVTRARGLAGITVTDIIDSHSSCETTALVATLVYGKPGEEPQRGKHFGTVVVHPEIELIAGAAQGQSSVVWNHADLAVVLLNEPVPLKFEPLTLATSEVELGDALVMIGYGPAGTEDPYGTRRFGENAVTEIRRYQTGNVIFGAAAPPGPDGGVPALARPGDSGGACVRKKKPNELLGIVTTWERTGTGGETSNFTSIVPHREWLLQFIRRAGPAPDAGVAPPPPEGVPDRRLTP